MIVAKPNVISDTIIRCQMNISAYTNHIRLPKIYLGSCVMLTLAPIVSPVDALHSVSTW